MESTQSTCISCGTGMGGDGGERKCRMCTLEERIRELERGSENRQIGQIMMEIEERIEDRIRALEQKAVGWQFFGERVTEIEERVEKAKQELAELETRLEGALLRSGSMEGSLEQMAKSQNEIRAAIQSLELELGSVESEGSGSEEEWIRVEGKTQQKVRKQQEQTTVGRVAQKPSETRVEQTATKEAGGQGREDAADRTEAKTEAGNGGKKGIGPTPIPQTKEIVVVGDSIARGIGARLREQHGNVRVFAKGGGTLADAEQKVDEVVLTGDEAVLVMTGGNDIDRGNGTEEVLERYERVVATLRSRGVKSITLVGPSTRRHFSRYDNSKVTGINQRLRRWCKKEGTNFVEGGIWEKDKIRLLARDGVHFSRSGEDFMVRKIYQSIRQHLNSFGKREPEVQ